MAEREAEICRREDAELEELREEHAQIERDIAERRRRREAVETQMLVLQAKISARRNQEYYGEEDGLELAGEEEEIMDVLS